LRQTGRSQALSARFVIPEGNILEYCSVKERTKKTSRKGGGSNSSRGFRRICDSILTERSRKKGKRGKTLRPGKKGGASGEGRHLSEGLVTEKKNLRFHPSKLVRSRRKNLPREGKELLGREGKKSSPWRDGAAQSSNREPGPHIFHIVHRFPEYGS